MNSTTAKAIPTSLTVALPVVKSGAWRRRLLIGLVVAYAGFLVIAPLVALTAGAFKEGLGAIIIALSQPDVLASSWRTLLVSLIVCRACCFWYGGSLGHSPAGFSGQKPAQRPD